MRSWAHVSTRTTPNEIVYQDTVPNIKMSDGMSIGTSQEVAKAKQAKQKADYDA
jgi:hypothetical protein